MPTDPSKSSEYVRPSIVVLKLASEKPQGPTYLNSRFRKPNAGDEGTRNEPEQPEAAGGEAASR